MNRPRPTAGGEVDAVTMTVEGDHIVADFTGTEEQRRGSCNLTLVATVSAVFNAILHMTDADIPANAGRYRPIEVIAQSGRRWRMPFPIESAHRARRPRCW